MWKNCHDWRQNAEGVGIDELYRRIDPFDVSLYTAPPSSHFSLIFAPVPRTRPCLQILATILPQGTSYHPSMSHVAAALITIVVHPPDRQEGTPNKHTPFRSHQHGRALQAHLA